MSGFHYQSREGRSLAKDRRKILTTVKAQRRCRA
jgi:hypothetical protein